MKKMTKNEKVKYGKEIQKKVLKTLIWSVIGSVISSIILYFCLTSMDSSELFLKLFSEEKIGSFIILISPFLAIVFIMWDLGKLAIMGELDKKNK